MLVDIHTHKVPIDKSVCAVYNPKSIAESKRLIEQKSSLFLSVGFHPWLLEKETLDFALLERLCESKSVKFVGECGLDKNIEYPLRKQLDIFEKQIFISEKLQKPFVIHCVGCFNEIIRLKKTLNLKQRWIIHGFRGKPELAKSLLKSGIELSYGSFHNPLSVVVTPPEHLFVETDDQNVDLRELYHTIASLKQCSVTELSAGKKLLLKLN